MMALHGASWPLFLHSLLFVMMMVMRHVTAAPCTTIKPAEGCNTKDLSTRGCSAVWYDYTAATPAGYKDDIHPFNFNFSIRTNGTKDFACGQARLTRPDGKVVPFTRLWTLKCLPGGEWLVQKGCRVRDLPVSKGCSLKFDYYQSSKSLVSDGSLNATDWSVMPGYTIRSSITCRSGKTRTASVFVCAEDVVKGMDPKYRYGWEGNWRTYLFTWKRL